MENNIIESLVDNWELVIALLCVIILSIQKIVEFIALPTAKKEAEIQAIILEWVREAEAELGSQTGKFKLAKVYERFCVTYPKLKKWYPLPKFELLVNDALKEMDKSFQNETTKTNALKLK